MNYPFSFAAFDMDGTLIDSMAFWRESTRAYLEQHGIAVSDELAAQLRSLPASESAGIARPLCEQAGVPPIPAEYPLAYLEAGYRTLKAPKPGVRAYLDALRAAGVRMCVATATPEKQARFALRQVGIEDYFEFVATPEQYPGGKKFRAIFDGIAGRFGAEPTQIAMIDDALYSLKTAKEVGYYCISVHDAYSAHHEAEARALAQEHRYFTEEQPY